MTAGTAAPAIERIESGVSSWKQFSWERIGALSGVAFVVLTFIGLTISDPNSADVDASPDQGSAVIASLFTENRADMELGTRFQIAGIAFMIFFVAYLYQRIRNAESGRGWIATAVLGGGLAYVAVMLIFITVGLAIASIDNYGADTAVARTLAALSWHVVEMLGAPLVAFIGGISVASLRYRIAPRWFGFAGLPLALAMLVGPVPYLGEVHWFGFLLFWLWILILAIYLVIRPSQPDIAAAA
jgi:hypothetical protein